VRVFARKRWSRNRRQWHEEIQRVYGEDERKEAEKLSDSIFGWYVALLSAGIEPMEAHRLAVISEYLGDDATNYTEEELEKRLERQTKATHEEMKALDLPRFESLSEKEKRRWR
jgi:hypothetical protein